MTVPRELIVRTARDHGLAPNLVEAVILQESGGDPSAWNPEPRYRYFWNVRTHTPFRPLSYAEIASEAPPVDFPTLAGDRDQEWWGQQASWGLMQVMGALARELGFAAPFLTALCDPAVNLRLGCAQLTKLMIWSHGDAHQAAAAYNGGRGGHTSAQAQSYAGKIIALLRQVDAAHPEAVRR